MEEVITELKKRLTNIEYKEIKELRDKICNIEVSLNQNNVLTELCTKSNEKMADTLDSVKEAMVGMVKSIEQNNRTSEELADSVKSLGNQVNALDNKINEIDNKSKFDIMDFIRKNWHVIIISAGILGYIFLK